MVDNITIIKIYAGIPKCIKQPLTELNKEQTALRSSQETSIAQFQSWIEPNIRSIRK